jgi:hypothetical protein
MANGKRGAVDGGWRMADGGQRTGDGGQRTARTADSRRWTAAGGWRSRQALFPGSAHGALEAFPPGGAPIVVTMIKSPKKIIAFFLFLNRGIPR